MSKTLTSRERVLKSLNHEEPDRVPIDLGGNQSGITKSAYKKLIEHLGIKDDIRTKDLVQELADAGSEVDLRLQEARRIIEADPGLVQAGFVCWVSGSPICHPRVAAGHRSV